MTVNMPDGYAIAEFETLDSTNKQAYRLAQMGAFGPMLIFTKNQSHGKGRNGRVWLSSNDTLTATILISSKAPKENVAQLAFVMAIAAHKTVCEFADADKHQHIGLKWPNDILVQGRKLAGILIESFTIKDNADSVLAIGIGMNIANIPSDGDFSASALSQLCTNSELDKPIKIETILSSLVQNFATYFDLWAEGKNFASIRKIWLANAIGLGGKITARLPNQSIYGVFERLDEDGILILRDEAGEIHQITAGDIFIGHI